MTALITTLITGRDNSEIVLEKIATILLEECAAQQVLAEETIEVAYTRADDSDYTAAAAADPGATLQPGDYTVTATTLLEAGYGGWTCTAPDATTETILTMNADDDLAFPTLGLTLTVTAGDTPFATGDVVTVTTYDPDDWSFRVFTERTNPWHIWENMPDQTEADARPLVSVSFHREDFDKTKSDTFTTFRADGRFVIDCYGYGKTAETESGQDPGDAKALSEAHRTARLVRQIIMAAHYAHLDLRGTVGDRFTDGIERFPAEYEERFGQHIRAFRLNVSASFNETSPQVEGNPCESIVGVLKREQTGEVFLTHRKNFDE